MAPRRSSEVKLSVEKISIPTYPVPNDNRNPMLFDNEWTDIYPYSLQDDLKLERSDRVYKAARLENEYTEVTVLPELGGHIWGAYDKAGGHEIFYRNHVVKPGLILLRGAWIPTGVEFNFPQGHNVNTLNHVDWHTKRSPDGSATIIVGDTERMQRMRWQVAITLRPGRSYIETNATLENRTHLPQRYYYWANAAWPATHGTQYVSSADWINSWLGAMPFPYDHKGINRSFYRNHPHSNDMFSIGDNNDFFGGYDYDSDTGLCHVADNALLPGKKFFTWGTQGGTVWATMLTDDDGPYIELQAGAFPTQADFSWLMPGQVVRIRELWYSVNGTRGFRFANDDVLLNYDLKGGRRPSLAVSLNSTRPFHRARLLVEADGHKLIDRRCDLSPGRLTEVSRELRRKGLTEPKLLFSVFDAEGNRVAVHRGKKVRRKPPKSEERPPILQRASGPHREMTADESCRLAIRLAAARLYSKAEKSIDECLAKDPGHTGACTLRAQLRLKSGLYEEALELAKRALERDLTDPGASYYEAIARRELGQTGKAKLALVRACKSAQWRAAVETRLAEIALAESCPIRAAELLGRSMSASDAPPRTHAMLATALRTSGDYAAARREVQALLAAEPTELLAQSESYLVERDARGKSKTKRALGRMTKALRGELQSYLEIACEYIGVGLYADALDIVRLGIRAEPRRKSAIPRYYAAWLLQKLGGRKKEVADELRAADTGSLEWQFPHRLEEERILRWAISTRKDDARACYMLGNLLAARRRTDEAIKYWRRSARSLPMFSVVHRNLARCLWQFKHDRKAASRYYKAALKAAPWDHKLYVEADKLFGELGMDRDRLRLFERVGELVSPHYEAAEQMAVMLVDTGHYHDAIEFMYSHIFKPWEGGRVMFATHIDAFVGLARKELDKGDLSEAENYLNRATDFPDCLHIGRPKEQGSAEALYLRGEIAAMRGKKREAADLWRRASRISERWGSEATYFAALASAKLGRKDKAKKQFEWLLESALEGFIGWSMDTPGRRKFLEGLAYFGLGKRAKAKACWREALNMDAGQRGARRFLAQEG